MSMTKAELRNTIITLVSDENEKIYEGLDDYQKDVINRLEKRLSDLLFKEL